jgi:hypothetical protein
MKKNIFAGIVIGICAGIIDVIPMLIQKLTWDANLSAFSGWVVISFFVSTSSLKLPWILKGLLISYLCIVPVLFIIGWKEPASLIPIALMTTILGCLVGIANKKFSA